MSGRKKKHEEHEEHANHERWMLSYADMLTLLLALFIVMFAISRVDQKKFEQFSTGTAAYFGEANQALKGSQGIMDGQPPNKMPNPSVPYDNGTPAPDDASKALAREQDRVKRAQQDKQNLEKLRQQIAKELAAKGLTNAVQFQIDERGLTVNIITDKVLFDSGHATLRGDGAQVLGLIAPSVSKLPNKVTVEGHTDNVPISGSGFASNWELSTARSTTVLQELLKDGIPAGRVSAAGYADQRPLDSNATESGRARNRRVAIVVLANQQAVAETGTAATPAAKTVVPPAPAHPAAAVKGSATSAPAHADK